MLICESECPKLLTPPSHLKPSAGILDLPFTLLQHTHIMETFIQASQSHWHSPGHYPSKKKFFLSSSRALYPSLFLSVSFSSFKNPHRTPHAPHLRRSATKFIPRSPRLHRFSTNTDFFSVHTTGQPSLALFRDLFPAHRRWRQVICSLDISERAVHPVMK